MNLADILQASNLRQNSSLQTENSDRSGNTTTLGCIPVMYPSQHVWRCGIISVELGRAQGKYGQPKHYAILYFSIAYAT